MGADESKLATDGIGPAGPTKKYVTPVLFVIGSAKNLLQDTFSQRYREKTSQYTTYFAD